MKILQRVIQRTWHSSQLTYLDRQYIIFQPLYYSACNLFSWWNAHVDNILDLIRGVYCTTHACDAQTLFPPAPLGGRGFTIFYNRQETPAYGGAPISLIIFWFVLASLLTPPPAHLQFSSFLKSHILSLSFEFLDEIADIASPVAPT